MCPASPQMMLVPNMWPYYHTISYSSMAHTILQRHCIVVYIYIVYIHLYSNSNRLIGVIIADPNPHAEIDGASSLQERLRVEPWIPIPLCCSRRVPIPGESTNWGICRARFADVFWRSLSKSKPFNDTYYSHKNMVQAATYWEFAIKVWTFTNWFGWIAAMSSRRHCEMMALGKLS